MKNHIKNILFGVMLLGVSVSGWGQENKYKIIIDAKHKTYHNRCFKVKDNGLPTTLIVMPSNRKIFDENQMYFEEAKIIDLHEANRNIEINDLRLNTNETSIEYDFEFACEHNCKNFWGNYQCTKLPTMKRTITIPKKNVENITLTGYDGKYHEKSNEKKTYTFKYSLCSYTGEIKKTYPSNDNPTIYDRVKIDFEQPDCPSSGMVIDRWEYSTDGTANWKEYPELGETESYQNGTKKGYYCENKPSSQTNCSICSNYNYNSPNYNQNCRLTTNAGCQKCRQYEKYGDVPAYSTRSKYIDKDYLNFDIYKLSKEDSKVEDFMNTVQEGNNNKRKVQIRAHIKGADANSYVSTSITYISKSPEYKDIAYVKGKCSYDTVNVKVRFKDQISERDYTPTEVKLLGNINAQNYTDTSEYDFHDSFEKTLDKEYSIYFYLRPLYYTVENSTNYNKSYKYKFKYQSKRGNIFGSVGSVEKSFKIETYPPIVFSKNGDPVPPTCNESNYCEDSKKTDGKIRLKIEGGHKNEEGYRYQYKLGADSTYKDFSSKNGSPYTISNLAPGTYQIYVRETDNTNVCVARKNTSDTISKSIKVTIESPEPIIYKSNKKGKVIPTTGYGIRNGNISGIEVQGGSGGYKYKWKKIGEQDFIKGETDSVIDSIGAGGYEFWATDEKGCSLRDTFYITQPDPLKVNISTIKPISCSAQNIYGDISDDGSLQAHITGGTKPYKVIWTKELRGSIDTVPNATLGATDSISTLSKTKGDNFGTEKNLVDSALYRVQVIDDKGIYMGNYIDSLNGHQLRKENIVYTDSAHHLVDPSLLEYSLTYDSVSCYGGANGWIQANIWGGTPDREGKYKVDWKNEKGELQEQEEGISNGVYWSRAKYLKLGEYSMHVVDSQKCRISNDEDTIKTKISQPAEPVDINFYRHSRPSIVGSSDGWIKAQVVGGTPYKSGRYEYQWYYGSNKEALYDIQTEYAKMERDTFEIKLKGVKRGIYTLHVKDSLCSRAEFIEAGLEKESKKGCQWEHSFMIYDPLEISLQEYKPISCNHRNIYNNKSKDGQIIATVKGGTPFTSIADGQRFVYIWEKQNWETGLWDTIQNKEIDPSNLSTIYYSKNDSILHGVDSGRYRLRVLDSLGYSIGEYHGVDEKEVLIQKHDSTISISDPRLLEATFETTPVSCDNGKDGTASILIKGGIGDKKINWSTGNVDNNKTKIKDLVASKYNVYVTDQRACELKTEVRVPNISELSVSFTTKKSPSCYLGKDGKLVAEVQGGKLPYQYSWSKEEDNSTQWADINTLENLTSGKYRLDVKDGNGCNASGFVTLKDPEIEKIDLGPDKTICSGQKWEIDLRTQKPEGTFLWHSKNNFQSTSPKVTIIEGGKYHAMYASPLGCIAEDSVIIEKKEIDIGADFTFATQAFVGESVSIINVSAPEPDSIKWSLPKEAILLEDNTHMIEVSFDKAGKYDLKLKAYREGCFAELTKFVIVNERENLPPVSLEKDQVLIKEFEMAPNPSKGNFKVNIEFNKVAEMSLKLIEVNQGREIQKRKSSGIKKYTFEFSEQLNSGMYILLLETGNESKTIKVLIVQ